jgi:hypothetical protein
MEMSDFRERAEEILRWWENDPERAHSAWDSLCTMFLIDRFPEFEVLVNQAHEHTMWYA